MLPPGKPARTAGGRPCHLEVLDVILHVLNRMPAEEGVEGFKKKEENYQALAEFADCLIA